MTPSEKIKICSTCQNRKWDKERGIVCNLTDQKPTFEFQCEHYLSDEKAVESVKQMESALGSETNDYSHERRRISAWLLALLTFGLLWYNLTIKDVLEDIPILPENIKLFRIAVALSFGLAIWSGLTFIGTAISYVISYFKGSSTGQKGDEISGWLFYFLWGIVAITTARLGIITYLFIELKLFDSFNMFAISIGTLFAITIGIYTIIAFYNRKSNAVALAYTYLGMIALLYISDCIAGGGVTFKTPAIALAIISIWGIYLRFSGKVNRIIPKSKRTWGLFEKIVLAIFFVMSITYCISTPPMKAKNTDSFDNSKIEQYIEKVKQQLPVERVEGIILQDITVNNKTIASTFIFKNEVWTEADIELYAKDVANYKKQEVIKELHLKQQYRYNEISNYLADNNYSFKYICKDATEQVIFEFVITPEEYKLSLPQQ